MGDVYLATRDGPGRFNKLLVLKELRPTLAADPTFVDMFLDEARLAARLSHPNVVQTHEISSEGGTLLHGHGVPRRATAPSNSLSLSAHGAGFRWQRASHSGEALAGLHYAHELGDYGGKPLGIVHRDVSPHNSSSRTRVT